MNKNSTEINDILLLSYLQKKTSVTENLFIEDWLKSNATNRKEFESIKQLWLVTSMTEDFENIDLDASWQKVKNKIKREDDPKVRKIDFSFLRKVAAAIILCIGISLTFFINDDTNLVASTTKEFRLPDGTQVWLKKGSELSYNDDFNTDTRTVRMTGEGYFNVEKNKNKPFIIELNNTKTTVLGTEFNLSSHNKNTTLVLVEGSVKFSNKNSFKIIKPGETVTATPAGSLSVSATKNNNFDSWKTKLLEFNQTALSKVIKDIDNVYETTVIIENENLLDCKLTSTFTNQSLEEIVETLTLLYQFSVVKQGNTIRLQKGNCPL